VTPLYEYLVLLRLNEIGQKRRELLGRIRRKRALRGGRREVIA
jgi:hypothetical protein